MLAAGADFEAEKGADFAADPGFLTAQRCMGVVDRDRAAWAAERVPVRPYTSEYNTAYSQPTNQPTNQSTNQPTNQPKPTQLLTNGVIMHYKQGYRLRRATLRPLNCSPKNNVLVGLLPRGPDPKAAAAAAAEEGEVE